MCETEKLIDLIKQRRLLYDLSDNFHKNRAKKAEAWLEIAKAMGKEDAKHWIVKWKNLKDNYNKFKKNNESASGHPYQKYKNWPWADQMRFLDGNIVRRQTFRNASGQTQECLHTNSIDSKPNTENLHPSIHAAQVSLREIPKSVAPSKIRQRKMKNSAGPGDNLQVREKNLRKSKLDGVDYFFLSYAQTFKKFPTRMQSMIKLELATLFARYEFQNEGDSEDSVSRMPSQFQRGYDSCSSTSNS